MPSDANQVSLFYAAETDFNETPDNSKALQELAYTQAELKIANVYQDAEEIRGDRQLAAQPKVGEETSAKVDVEFSMKALNDFFAACLGSSWTTVSPGAQTATIAATGQTITLASGTFAAFANCRYVKVAGASNSANNGVKKVASISGGVLTLAAGSLVADQTGASLTITGKYVRTGTTLTTFLLEQKFALMDAGSNRFKRLSGVAVNDISLDIQAKSKVKATVNFMGASGAYAATTSGDGSPIAKTGLPIVTTNANVATIYRGGTAIAVPVQSIPLSIKNNVRVRPALGQQNTLAWGLNEFDVSGTLNAYFTDKALVSEMVAGTVSSLEFALVDAGGKVLNFYMPLVKLLQGDPNPNSKNSDVMTPLTFRALGSDSAKVLQLDYLEA